MNPFSSNKGISLGLLIAVGFTSGLVAAELHDGAQPNNELIAAQLQLIEDQACPYPPQTPAAAGAEGGQPEAMQPRRSRQPAIVIRPAIYLELMVPAGDADQPIFRI
jgi:hypothetical protein